MTHLDEKCENLDDVTGQKGEGYKDVTYEQMRDDMVRTINRTYDHAERLRRFGPPEASAQSQIQPLRTDGCIPSLDVASQESEVHQE